MNTIFITAEPFTTRTLLFDQGQTVASHGGHPITYDQGRLTNGRTKPVLVTEALGGSSGPLATALIVTMGAGLYLRGFEWGTRGRSLLLRGPRELEAIWSTSDGPPFVVKQLLGLVLKGADAPERGRWPSSWTREGHIWVGAKRYDLSADFHPAQEPM